MLMLTEAGVFRRQDARRERLIATAHEIGQRHAPGAALHDRDGTVHRALLDDLCAAGYLAAPIEARHGGGNHRLVDVVLAQAALAEHDAATALGVGMHLMVVGAESRAPRWPEWRRQEVLRGAAHDRWILNVLATEPGMGAPQGNTRPDTTLRPDGAGAWRLDGAKSFATFAPVLTHALVYCAVNDGSGMVGRVLVPMFAPGVRIEETWDTLGMRATASHTVHFEDVMVRDREIVSRHPFTSRAQRPAMSPWFALPVAAVYLGIARAARDEAVAAFRRARAGRTPAAEAEGRRAVAEIEQRVLIAEAALLTAAATADGDERTVQGVSALESATKRFVTTAAIECVDLAMRVAAGGALQRGARLERLWRDVRSGPVHPPTDAAALSQIAAHAIGD